MKIKLLLGIATSLIIFTSCENLESKESLSKKNIDYTDMTVLDSLITKTPQSKDTLFLGFTIGMNKSDYKNHIHQLRKEGKNLSYSDSNILSTLAGKVNLGSGYTFITSISTEISVSGKTLTGEGRYFLEPVYNKSGLIKLNIVPIEKWNGDYDAFSKPKWLRKRIEENSEQLKDDIFRQALIDNNVIREYDFVRRKGNLIIYENSLSIHYIDLKALLMEFLINETEKEIITEKNEDIVF